MQIYLNGQYLEKAEAALSLDDRGFIFGDGIYEVFRAIEGRLFEGEGHQRRLERGLAELRIAPPAEADAETLAGIAARLLEANGHAQGQATVYVQITRGAAVRTHYFPPAEVKPTVYVATAAFKPNEAQHRDGVKAITRDDVRWLRCDIKTVQLLPNVLAKQAAVEAGAFEAVFIRGDLVTEGTHSNLFGVVDGVIRTHPANNFILPGITRTVVLELARELGLPVREEAITREELPAVEELFFTGTTTDVMPVVELDGRTVGDGRPGPIATQLYEALVARMEGAPARA